MKVKNIMFSGFAAAIFAGVCGAAEAAVTYELTSKSYVDTELAKKQDNLTAGTGISIENNVVKSTLDLTPFATTTDMQAADQALQGKIDAEATARANADSALDGKITAMDAAYKLADTGLQSQIDAVKDLTGNEGVADQISAAVNAEKNAREQADAAMAEDISENAQAIADEATARANADAAMAEDIADLVAADSTLDGKIAAEASARAQADTALENAYKAADLTLDGKITAEATARENADTAMDTRVSTAEGEIDALQAADTTIRGEFAAADEALEDAYKAADTILDGKISTNAQAIADEATARANADTALENAYKAADAEVLAGAKKYTDDEIAELNQSLTGTATNLGELTTRVSTAEGEIDALQAADTTIRSEFAAADKALEGAYKAADEELDGKISAEVTARTNADTALDNKISGLSTDLSTAKDDIKAAYEAADAQVLADAKADAKSKADAVKDLVDAEHFVSANGILTTKGGYLVISDGAGNITLNQVAVVNGDGKTDIITGESLQ